MEETHPRKPLLIRGARQVGKSFLVREFGKKEFLTFVEINFERNPEFSKIFLGGTTNGVLQQLETHFHVPLRKPETDVLLFLDEIQAAPRVLPQLRYFHEEYPGLAVVAAGSLLDTMLAEEPQSMPVGRVEYFFLGPMIFEEFLEAKGDAGLLETISKYALGGEIPEFIHGKLLEAAREFFFVGGMPEAVATYATTHSLLEVERIKQSILSTFQDDFYKYVPRTHSERLRKVFRAITRHIGEKWKHVRVGAEERSRDVKRALDLLEEARVCYRVKHSAANGVPLGAEAREDFFKVLFLDVGLACGASGLEWKDLLDLGFFGVARGAYAEQFVGQHLLYGLAPWREPELHYWARERRGASAEVDYVISKGAEIIPIEVKAGKAGTLKSLRLFVDEKKVGRAVRFNAEPPSILRENNFELVSLPLYLAGQLRRIIGQAHNGHPTYIQHH